MSEGTPLAYSVKQFCKAAGDISVRHFYALQERGEGPLVTHLGGRTVVTHENGKRWLEEQSTA